MLNNRAGLEEFLNPYYKNNYLYTGSLLSKYEMYVCLKMDKW